MSTRLLALVMLHRTRGFFPRRRQCPTKEIAAAIYGLMVSLLVGASPLQLDGAMCGNLMRQAQEAGF